MARINIPKSEYRVLQDLAELPDASFCQFLSGLAEIEPSIHELDFSALLVQKVPTISPPDLKAFLRTLLPLYRMMDTRERTAPEVAADIKETIDRQQPQGFPLDKTDLVRQRIAKLLSVGGWLAVLAKAQNVRGDQERLFCAARILSDVRPVFGNTPDSISAAVVVHSLNITYHQDGEHKDFYVALDTNDLRNLKKTVERAEKKHETLKSLIQKSTIRYFDGE